MNIKANHLILITILSVLLGFLNPLQMLAHQSFLLASLIWVVAVWSTNALDRSLASLIVIFLFWFFGNLGLIEIINFAWSDTSLLIMTTSVLSVAIAKTGLVDQIIKKLIFKFDGSLLILMVLPYLIGIVLVFLIPQAFARVILLGGILNSILSDDQAYKEAKKVILFNSFMAIVVTSMLFSNGDIVLNQTTLSFAGPEIMQSLNFTGWLQMMGIPTLVTIVFLIISIFGVFKDELKSYTKEMIVPQKSEDLGQSKTSNRFAILTMILVMISWMTEPMHGIPGWIFALVAILIMLTLGTIEWKDLKAINPPFILFLTAAFSIGKVMGASGVSDQIFNRLQNLIPSTNSVFFLLALVVIMIILHMFIGSSVATMSVALPFFLTLGQGSRYPLEVITLIAYIVVLLQFIFPIHHQTLMIGSAAGYYEDRHIVRFGLYSTLAIFIIVFLFYLPWWKMIGIF